MRERLHYVCCRQDKRKAGQEPGGGTCLDTSTGEPFFVCLFLTTAFLHMGTCLVYHMHVCRRLQVT